MRFSCDMCWIFTRLFGYPSAAEAKYAQKGSSAQFGEVAEWSKAAVLKTVEGKPSQGSNPCFSAIQKTPLFNEHRGFLFCRFKK